MVKHHSSAPFSDSKTSNEVARKGGLPPEVRARARAIRDANPGWSLSRAIATALSQYKKERAKGKKKGTVVAGKWDALKAKMRAS
jgi:hypothetical protein